MRLHLAGGITRLLCESQENFIPHPVLSHNLILRRWNIGYSTSTGAVARGNSCLLLSYPVKYAKFMLNRAEVPKTTPNNRTVL